MTIPVLSPYICFIMDIELLRSRHSVRSYVDTLLPEVVRNHLKAEVTQIRTMEQGIHFQLFFDDGDPFKGFKSSYGLFKGVRNYLACVVDTTTPFAYQRAGYFAQQFVMYAVSLGLATCYVGGTYDKKRVKAQFRAGWELPFIIVFGEDAKQTGSLLSRFMVKQIHRHDRKPIDFLIGTEEEKKAMIANDKVLASGLEGIACAPSAVNRQPVRVKVDNGEIIAFTEGNTSRDMVDLGIAMWNFRAAAGGEWDFGNPAIYLRD